MTTPPDVPPTNQAPPPDPNGGPPPATNKPPTLMDRLGPVQVGDRGIKFSDMDTIMRFAKAVAASQFCPEGFSDIDCFICISRGLEIGMTAMQALESIYVVNRRATIFGDAPKALCEASGLMEDYEQHYEGEEGTDDFRAVVMSKRRGRQPQTETFSVRDAKTAELWGKASKSGKPGPWVLYPKRMLMFRARGYNLRDNFGDVLKGFTIGELVDDFDTARQVAGRVVEPNLANGALPQPSAQDQLPQAWQQGEAVDLQAGAKRHRRTKAEMEAAKAQENAAETKSAPATGTVTRTSLFPEPEKKEEPTAAEDPPTTNGLAGEIIKRLKAAEISQERFLVLLADVGAIAVAGEAVSQGHFTISHVPEATLQMALEDWENVLLRLKGAAQS